MNKAQLIRQIVVCMTESLGVLEKAARASHAEATHESSKAESKYDTPGLEAAYLGGGRARQAKEQIRAEHYEEIRREILRNFLGASIWQAGGHSINILKNPDSGAS